METDLRLFPEQASSVAAQVDAVFFYLCAVSIFFSLLIAGLIIFFAIRYRRGSRADRREGHGHFFAIEATWIIIPFLLTMVMFFWGADVYFRMVRAPADAIEINTVAKQWMWKFQHPEGNLEINDLHVPLGRAVKLRMISEDVIHSFYVPAFRVKQDVLPGRYTTLWFEATRLGEYHLFCAEYCGAKHSEMKGRVIVLEPAHYQEWLAGSRRGETPIESGRKLFEERRCDQCHKPAGEQGRGPPLEDLFGATVPLANGETVTVDEAYLRESILHPAAKVRAGFQPVMPTFEGQIGEEGILHLIAYIKSLTTPER